MLYLDILHIIIIVVGLFATSSIQCILLVYMYFSLNLISLNITQLLNAFGQTIKAIAIEFLCTKFIPFFKKPFDKICLNIKVSYIVIVTFILIVATCKITQPGQLIRTDVS